MSSTDQGYLFQSTRAQRVLSYHKVPQETVSLQAGCFGRKAGPIELFLRNTRKKKSWPFVELCPFLSYLIEDLNLILRRRSSFF